MAAGTAYALTRRLRRPINLLLPRAFGELISPYGPEDAAGHEYAVAIGHTKGDLRAAEVTAAAARLIAHSYEIVRLSDLAALAREDLLDASRNAEQEADYQVAREYSAVLGTERNDQQSSYLQGLIPLDRDRVLDLGCGAGYWASRIATSYPWMRVVGVDVGEDFITAANSRYRSDRVSFAIADFGALPFVDASFDCVYADNSLEHAYDVDGALAEAHRVLDAGGILVAAVPSDGRNPAYACDNHTWKTLPVDFKARLAAAGFVNVEIEEIDIVRRLGAPPFAPSNNKMMFVRAWKRGAPATQLDRAEEAMSWLYHRLDPTRASTSNDAIDVIAGGTAFCAGYAVALGTLLEREGYDVRWIAMEARDHPRGRGKDATDSHVAIQTRIDGRWHVLDAMANTVIPHSLLELLRDPHLAQGKSERDDRYRERGYHFYDTAFWYSRVTRFRIHRSVNPHIRIWRRNRHRAPTPLPSDGEWS